MNRVPALDRVFHERGRLALCTTLIANPDGISFTALQEACSLTHGNLNRHLHALAEINIVDMRRKTGAGRPQTIISITPQGRDQFLEYIDALETIVRKVQSAAEPGASSNRLATT
ncbi:MAG: transcriptional regulator [Candidatus Eremiobacteraeota bacterium]|nr:transcriptional regulator [Candidatus Eremiobacteraeota bacterium]